MVCGAKDKSVIASASIRQDEMSPASSTSSSLKSTLRYGFRSCTVTGSGPVKVCTEKSSFKLSIDYASHHHAAGKMFGAARMPSTPYAAPVVTPDSVLMTHTQRFRP